MKHFYSLCVCLLRETLRWGLCSLQGISLGVILITLVVPPRFLLADPPSPAPMVAAMPKVNIASTAPAKLSAATPHKLGAPARPGPTVKDDKWKPLAKRIPNEKGLYKSGISLRALDLKKVPTEDDLRMAGQMGSPLTPTGSADASKISDPTKRKKQEGDNMLFGQAIQKWNQHDYKGAVALFEKHRMAYSDSPWAGEAELHLGCEAQFTGNWEEARVHFDQVLSGMPKGSDIYQKVKLRRAVLHMDQGELDQASQCFTEMLQTETDWQRRTYAQRWLLDLSHYKGHELALRTCGSNSIAYVLRAQGKNELAANVASVSAPTDRGFSLGDLTGLANKVGLTAVAVRAEGAEDLEKLPTPFIAHYRDQHFVVVNGLAENGDVRLYDPRLEHETRLSAEGFRQQWSDLAILFQAKPAEIALASEGDLNEQMGGCCGIPRYPSGLGPNCPLSCCGMPGWSVNPINFNVCIQDIPMWHDNQYGPKVEIKLTYNSEDSLVQMRPVGNKWVLNYASYLMISPGNEPSGSVLVVMPDGRGDIYQPNGNGGFNPPAGVFNRLTALPQVNAYTFNLTSTDGTIYRYGIPPEMGPNSFSSLLLSVSDRFGNSVTISHNTNGSINQIIDPLNNKWTFVYNAQGYVGQVNDPFSRQATFSYDGNGNLTGQTDMGGVAYGYSYDSNVDLTALIKPSGTTKFYIEPAQDGTQGTQNTSNGSNAYPPYGGSMWANYRVTVTDPQGYAEEYYYDGYSHYGWHRDQNQFQSPEPAFIAPKTRYDYQQLNTNSNGVIAKITYADGNYIQYSYGNQNSSANLLPSQVIRSLVLPSGNTVAVNETTNLTYNNQGRLLTWQDAKNNTINYQYNLNGVVGNDGFDLAKITDPLGHDRIINGYDSARNVNSITDATNNTTTISYNVLGERSGVTNAAQHAITYNYNSSNQLTSLSQGNVTLRSFVYDSIGRVQSDTDADGHTLIYEYDGLNRLTKTIYPDSTNKLNNYSCCWLQSQTDRLGRTTSYTRDFRGKPLIIQQADDSLVQLLYDAVGNLAEIVDGNGNVTQWGYDANNRNSTKTYADGSIYAFVYDGVGNLSSRTDAKNVTVNYSYDANNNLTGITAPGLTPITYAYDVRNWMSQMTDAVGTTTFGYDLAGRRNSIAGPFNNDTVSINYDALGRVGTQNVNGQISTFVYNDSLERLTSSSTPIGNFTYAYRSVNSFQIASIGYPNGQSVAISYYGGNLDNHPSQISNTTSNGMLSQFGYQYDANEQINQWTQQVGGGHPLAYQMQQDALGQLVGAISVDAVTNAVTQTYGYGYDSAENRIFESSGSSVSRDVYNNLNQLTTRQGNGAVSIPIKGSVNKPSTVTVNGGQAFTKTDGSFSKLINVYPGNNAVAIAAVDRNNNVTNHNYQIVVNGSGDNRTESYDANGNLQAMSVSGSNTTYEWDALDRLTAINQGMNRSEFIYDGMNCLRQITEKANGAVTSNQQFTRVGPVIAEVRDTVTSVTKRYSGCGVSITGGSQAGNYYYSFDHLGSVREVTDAGGNLRAEYAYDLYGLRTKVSGNIDVDASFTGYWHHTVSGMEISLTRFYNPSLRRWISRDPLRGSERTQGPNLYAYVGNNPVNCYDPNGEELIGALIGGAAGAIIGGISGGWSGAAGGFVGGVVGGLTFNPELGMLAGGALSGLLSGAAGDATSQLLSGQPFNFCQLLTSAAGGGLGGGLFGGALGLAGGLSGFNPEGALTAAQQFWADIAAGVVGTDGGEGARWVHPCQ